MVMHKRQRKPGLRRADSGTALVEAAMTLMLAFVLLFGIMEAGRFLHVQQTLTQAAREAARLSVAPITQTDTMASIGQIKAEAQKYLDVAQISGADIDVQQPVVIDTGGVPTEFTRVTVTL